MQTNLRLGRSCQETCLFVVVPSKKYQLRISRALRLQQKRNMVKYPKIKGAKDDFGGSPGVPLLVKLKDLEFPFQRTRILRECCYKTPKQKLIKGIIHSLSITRGQKSHVQKYPTRARTQHYDHHPCSQQTAIPCSSRHDGETGDVVSRYI